MRSSRALVALLLVCLVAQPARADVVFGPDAFTVGADANLDAYPSGSPTYTYSGGTGDDLIVNAANDRVQLGATSSDDALTYVHTLSSSMGPQEARAYVQLGAASQEIGVGVRSQTTDDSYTCNVFGTAPLFQLSEITGGTWAQLASGGTGSTGVQYSVAFRAVGSVLTCWVNGERVTVTDATLSTGRPGVAGFDFSAAPTSFLDDFSVDNLGTGTGIWLVDTGAQAVGTTSGANVACAYPSGYTATANDFGLLIVSGRPTDTANVSAPSGWTDDVQSLREVGANDLKVQTMFRIIQGGDSAPNVVIPASWSGTAAGVSCQMAIWRGVDTTTPRDATSVTSNAAAAATFTPTGITTVTNEAQVVGIVASADDNALRMSTFQGFVARMGGASFDTTTGGDHAVAIGDFRKSALGATTAPTWTQALVGNDAWAGIVIALRPASGAAPTTVPTLPLLGVGVERQVESGNDLTWVDNATNETEQRIERSAPNQGFQPLATVAADLRTYRDRAVTRGLTYCYRLRACHAGGCSAYSNEACGVVQ